MKNFKFCISQNQNSEFSKLAQNCNFKDCLDLDLPYRLAVDNYETMDGYEDSRSYLKIELQNTYVQNVEDNIAYDFQSFIGEVGGTLGLFLGLSFVSFIEFTEFLIGKIFFPE